MITGGRHGAFSAFPAAAPPQCVRVEAEVTGLAQLLDGSTGVELEAAKAVAAQGLSVRQTEALAKRLATPKEERKLSNDERIAESYGRLAAQELSDKIGRTCRIVSGRKKGRIELDYYGIDDLNDLLEALAAIKRRKNGGE